MNSKHLLDRWQLSGHDRRKLAVALPKATDARHGRRLQAVLLVTQGQPVQQVSHMTHLTRQSIYNALDRYRQRRRPQDLADQPRPGRPTVAPAINTQQIRQALQQDPLEAGYQTTTWTTGLLAQYLQKHSGQAISPRTLRRRMRQARLRWKRPRYVYKSPDPHKPQKKGASVGA